MRTTDPNCTSWKGYGGKGITTCDRWLHGEGDRVGFECFIADMGPRPLDTSIDRIDAKGNYEPGNCRWADAHTQANNKINSKLTTADVREIKRAIARGLPPRDVAQRMGIHPAYVGQIARGERRSQG